MHAHDRGWFSPAFIMRPSNDQHDETKGRHLHIVRRCGFLAGDFSILAFRSAVESRWAQAVFKGNLLLSAILSGRLDVSTSCAISCAKKPPNQSKKCENN